MTSRSDPTPPVESAREFAELNELVLSLRDLLRGEKDDYALQVARERIAADRRAAVEAALAPFVALAADYQSDAPGSIGELEFTEAVLRLLGVE